MVYNNIPFIIITNINSKIFFLLSDIGYVFKVVGLIKVCH